MKKIRLDIILKLESSSALIAWEIFYFFLCRENLSPDAIVSIYGKNSLLKNVHDILKNENASNFKVEIEGTVFGYSKIGTWKHELMYIESQSQSVTDSLESFVDFICIKNGFVQAWISDFDYFFWQNATDILQYEANGRDYENLPLVSNGLPPPLEQLEIDISNNPGRRCINLGFVEVVSSIMWLSDCFFEVTGGSKCLFMKKYENKISVLNESVIKFKFLDNPFDVDSDVGVQIELRRDLFGHN